MLKLTMSFALLLLVAATTAVLTVALSVSHNEKTAPATTAAQEAPAPVQEMLVPVNADHIKLTAAPNVETTTSAATAVQAIPAPAATTAAVQEAPPPVAATSASPEPPPPVPPS